MVAGQSVWLLLILVAAAGGCFYGGFRFWGLSRTVADTAQARIRSAPHGYVELYGRAEFAPETKNRSAPLTGRECVWWSYRIERKVGRNTETIEKGTSDTAFVLRDDTGACVVDPRGALIKPHDSQVWHGSESWPSSPQSTVFSPFGEYTYFEQRIYPFDGVCVLGELATVGGVGGSSDAEVAALLHDWKADSAQLLRRFDKDGDGELSAEEWEQARAAAQAEVLSRQAATPLVKQMGKPRDGRPYVLAASDPAHLAQSYRLQAVAWIAGFFIALMALVKLFLP